ncbi:MAG TPA: hypothetical protein VFX31_05055, partial [Ktedonobacterales bacterium]|nr:hypothetical protein [Ktedonobacterales bacterium]
ALALILVLVGLALLLSAGDSNSATALTRIELAAGVVNIGAKLAIIVAALAAFFAGQQSEWGWVAALVILGLVTLFSGPLSALTNAGNILFFAAPLAVALLALIYSFRIHGNLAPVNAWWRASR